MRLIKTFAAPAAISVSILALAAVAGCGREADRPARSLAEESASTLAAPEVERAVRRADTGGARPGPAPLYRDNTPIWASNQRSSGEDNARRQFERNGADFTARSLEDYVAKAHAFVGAPPRGVLRTTRSNGDVLYYDPRTNVFVVADRRGAPRTMFKPREGMAYWTEQQASAAERRSDRRPRRERSEGAGDQADAG